MPQESFSDKKKQEIIEKLMQKGVRSECPMCRHDQFILADGYFNQPIQQNVEGIVIGGPSIPTIAIICKNCGFTSQHAVGILGLLPIKKSEPEVNK